MQVYQRIDVVAQRHKVLRALPDYRARGYEIFYQEESFVNANHTCQYVWQNENYGKDERNDMIKDTRWSGGLNVPSGKGQRIIINHIGSKNVFLEGAREYFVGKKGSDDYHQEMNATHFERWWETKVLPALPDKSVAGIHNAKYHSRQTEDSKKPTTAWKKDTIKE